MTAVRDAAAAVAVPVAADVLAAAVEVAVVALRRPETPAQSTPES